MMKKYITAIVISALFITVGCKKEETACNYSPNIATVPAAEKDSLARFMAINYPTAQAHSSGMYYIIEAAGGSKKPTHCSFVQTYYVGSLLGSNVVFDRTNGTPASFTVGQLIDGCKQGLQMIGSNGKISLFIPPSLAYGPQGVVNAAGTTVIPPNAYLKFDFELLTAE